MKVYENKSQFGWENDNGIGEQLINQIISGKKTATAGPKDLYTSDELETLYRSVSKPTTVVDKNNTPRCNIELVDVFETSFGSPDPRLIEGEGYGKDAELFKADHKTAWADLIESGELDLNDETVLIVELFRLLPE